MVASRMWAVRCLSGDSNHLIALSWGKCLVASVNQTSTTGLGHRISVGRYDEIFLDLVLERHQ